MKNKVINNLKSFVDFVFPPSLASLPVYLIVVGIIVALVGFFVDGAHFMHAWLVSFMFYLSICLGGFFLVLLHYLLDSQWIVPVRRVAENLACLLPFMAVLFLPIALWSLLEVKIEVHSDAHHHTASQDAKLEKAQAKFTSLDNATNKAKSDSDTNADAQQASDHHSNEKVFYQWMKSEREYKTDKEKYKKTLKEKNPDISDSDLDEKVSHMPIHDHAWYAKKGYLSKTSWSFRWIFCFVSWGVFTWLMRKHSIAQDKDGSSKWTSYNRKLAAAGIFVFAFTTTTAAIDGMKSLEHQWFSTMYGVYYFAGSFWVSLITMYSICLYLKNKGPLKDVARKETFKDLGTLFFAFTVFYSYIHFSQYFLIWNAAIPEETFWYVKREQGPWWNVGMIILFGHFFIPFLTLLRQDVKTNPTVMITISVVAWYVHFCDMSYNVMPLIHEAGGWMSRIWIDVGCMLFMGGCLAMLFIYFFNKNAPYPQRDPRIAETMGVYVKLNSECQNSGK